LIQGTNPLLFGGHDPTNKLPYSENWQLDVQWQPINTIAINQPFIATASNPVNGQTASYDYQVPGVAAEQYNTSTGDNTDLRAQYLGYSPNSVFYRVEGISNYNALQVSVQKRVSHGLMVTGAPIRGRVSWTNKAG